MRERTCRRVIAARRNQRLVGETSRVTRASASSYPCKSPLIHFRHNYFGILALLALFGAIVNGPVAVASVATCIERIDPPTPVTAVHVQPESGIQPVLDEINFARCSIDLSMYMLTSGEIVDALGSAIDRGIRVRVILERQPFGTFGDQQEMYDTLLAIGAEVQWGPDRFTYSHAKYMIVDGSALLVTNQNFTGAGFDSNREFGLITTELRFVNEAVAIFESDWSGAEFQEDIEHLVVSPINARATVLGLIEGSQETIWMYSEVLRDEEVTDALSRASGRGVDVRILVNPSASEEDAPYFLDALSHNVNVRVLKNPYVHSKVIIVDGQAALVGSHNYSYTSLELNREIGIVVTDETNLDVIIATYSRDWTRAEPVDSVATALSSAPVTCRSSDTCERDGGREMRGLPVSWCYDASR